MSVVQEGVAPDYNSAPRLPTYGASAGRALGQGVEAGR